MTSINMIAARRAEKKRIENLTRRLIYGIAAEFGVFLLVSSSFAMRLVATKYQCEKLDIRIEKLGPQVRQIEQIRSDIADLAPKASALSEANREVDAWRNALYDISVSLPKDMWLSSLTSSGQFYDPAAAQSGGSQSDQTPALTLSAYASSQFSVGAAMLAMNGKPSVSKVTLADMSEQQSAAGAPPSSGVACHLVVSLKDAEAPAAGGKSG